LSLNNSIKILVKPYPTPLTRTPYFVWQPGQLRPGHAIINSLTFVNAVNDGTDGYGFTN